MTFGLRLGAAALVVDFEGCEDFVVDVLEAEDLDEDLDAEDFDEDLDDDDLDDDDLDEEEREDDEREAPPERDDEDADPTAMMFPFEKWLLT